MRGGLSFLCLLIVTLMLPHAGTFAQEQIAIVQDKRIDECSGLACCRSQNSAIWMHNDSGDAPRLFLVGLDGDTQCVCYLRNTDAVDWEDMCSFEISGQKWLLVGDIGDNAAKRTRQKNQCTLYLLKEPDVSQAEEQRVDWDVRIRFDYEDGPHNCEGVAVDPERKEILLLTKESPLSTGVYRLPLQLRDKKQLLTAERIASLPIAFATGLDISPDGRLLMGISMWDGWVCQREADQSWAKALRGTIHRVALPQREQGEAVCFTADGQHLLVNSENKQQPLWRLKVADVLP